MKKALQNVGLIAFDNDRLKEDFKKKYFSSLEY